MILTFFLIIINNTCHRTVRITYFMYNRTNCPYIHTYEEPSVNIIMKVIYGHGRGAYYLDTYYKLSSACNPWGTGDFGPKILYAETPKKVFVVNLNGVKVRWNTMENAPIYFITQSIFVIFRITKKRLGYALFIQTKQYHNINSTYVFF